MTDTTKPAEGGYMVYTPTLRERFWRKLGFRYHLGEEHAVAGQGEDSHGLGNQGAGRPDLIR